MGEQLCPKSWLEQGFFCVAWPIKALSSLIYQTIGGFEYDWVKSKKDGSVLSAL